VNVELNKTPMLHCLWPDATKQTKKMCHEYAQRKNGKKKQNRK